MTNPYYVGQLVNVVFIGRKYLGVVVKVFTRAGVDKVQVRFTTGSGKTRVKSYRASPQVWPIDA